VRSVLQSGLYSFIDVVADLWPVLFLRPNGSELV